MILTVFRAQFKHCTFINRDCSFVSLVTANQYALKVYNQRKSYEFGIQHLKLYIQINNLIICLNLIFIFYKRKIPYCVSIDLSYIPIQVIPLYSASRIGIIPKLSYFLFDSSFSFHYHSLLGKLIVVSFCIKTKRRNWCSLTQISGKSHNQ